MNGDNHFQFSLTTCFWVVTVVAVGCAVARMTEAIPTWSIPPVLLISTAWYVARHGRSSDVALALLSAGWLWAACDVVHTTVNGLWDVYSYPTVHHLRRIFVVSYWSRVAVPATLLLPTAYVIIKRGNDTRSLARRWLWTSIVVAFVDVTLLTILQVAITYLAFPE